MTIQPKFGSIFLAGFECSTQRRWDNSRLDLIEATRHFEFCEKDYAQCNQHGLKAARDGFRWHLIGAQKGTYDWSSVRPMLRASKSQHMTVIWDLCHYGYPDWLDIWSDEFLKEFAAFTTEAVKLIRSETGMPPLICPVNEISFWSWLGGKEGKISPYTIDRGDELKRRLVQTKLASIKAAKAIDPEAVIICAEPLINIVRDTNDECDIIAAAQYHNSQYQAVDLMLGQLEPEIGGFVEAVDMIGVNYYPHNQWRIRGGYVPMGHHDYKPFSELLIEIWNRYRKPILIAETGCEYSARPAWMSYVCDETRTALDAGVPIHGICVYPITDYKGWDNDRMCEVGLFGSPSHDRDRPIYMPLLNEINRQITLFQDGDLTLSNSL